MSKSKAEEKLAQKLKVKRLTSEVANSSEVPLSSYFLFLH
jgi:hypothetical protein